MPIMQKVPTKAGEVPALHLCGWGVWHGPTEFDLIATKEVVRKSVDLWDGGPEESRIYPRLHVVGAAPYKAGGRSMLWEVGRKVIGKDPENYAQEVGDPFVAGTQVLMADGSEKKIEDLVIGDVVVNHKNQPARVTRVIKKKFTGNLVTIKVKGWHRPLTATSSHHGMILPYSGHRFAYEGVERVQFGKMLEGDHVLTPFGYEPDEDIVLDLVRILKYDHFDDDAVYRGKEQLPRFIPVDAKFARLLGLYLAEGGLGTVNNSVSWSYGTHETVFIKESINSIKEIFNLDAKVWRVGVESCRRVGLYSAMLHDFFATITPGNIYSKAVPTFIFRTRRSIRLEVLRGWLDGDGDSPTKTNRIIGYTSSDLLGDSMLRLATSCGLRTSSWRRMRKKRARVANTEIGIFGTEISKVYSTMTLPCPTRTITCRDTPYGLARKIQKITYEPVVDRDVYCITTEGEYTAIFNGIAQYQCVSFGAKNAIEYVQFFPMANGERLNWTMVFPPYLWGCGRIFIGNNQLGRQDGSIGVWQAKAVMEYGTISRDEEGVPEYSGSVARQWGNNPGPSQKWVDLGKQHIVKSAAAVSTWEDVVTALTNGYPVTIASNVGFDMTPRSDGFHHYSTHWGHQLCIIGVDDDPSDPYACILNSWGADVHGVVKDFKTGEIWPGGTLRVRRADVEAILAEEDSFAFSSLTGFPAQEVHVDLW